MQNKNLNFPAHSMRANRSILSFQTGALHQPNGGKIQIVILYGAKDLTNFDGRKIQLLKRNSTKKGRNFMSREGRKSTAY